MDGLSAVRLFFPGYYVSKFETAILVKGCNACTGSALWDSAGETVVLLGKVEDCRYIGRTPSESSCPTH